MAEPLKTMPEACDVSPDAINTTQADRRSVVEAVRGSYKHLGEMRWAMKDSCNSEMSHISDMQDHPSPSVTTLRFACMVLIALRARRLSEALGQCLYDLQGRKLANLMESHNGTSLPVFDLSPYPAGTYLVKINFERGVSVVRKVVKQ